jgi:DNA modification methylase
MEILPNNIYLGDSYKLIKEIPDKSIDCIYTDIPYLIGVGTRTLNPNASSIAKCVHKMQTQDLAEIKDGIDMAILDDFVRIMKKINIFIWCSKAQVFDIMKYFIDGQGCYSDILFWGKRDPIPATNNSWLPDVEYCLYFREKNVPLNDGFHIKSKFFISNKNMYDKKHFSHPTIKPLELVERHLKHTTQPNDVIFDPFLGSGTTALAAKNTNRRYIGFEIDPKWYEISVSRMNGINAHGQTSIFTNFEDV